MKRGLWEPNKPNILILHVFLHIWWPIFNSLGTTLWGFMNFLQSKTFSLPYPGLNCRIQPGVWYHKSGFTMSPMSRYAPSCPNIRYHVCDLCSSPGWFHPLMNWQMRNIRVKVYRHYAPSSYIHWESTWICRITFWSTINDLRGSC